MYQLRSVKSMPANMAGSVRFLFADFFNKSNSFKSLRITKNLSNGGHNRACSTVDYSRDSKPISDESVEESTIEPGLNRAVRIYIQQAKDYDIFMKQQVVEFEKGKKFLARIMGKDVKNFKQEEIDEAIEYLFPSALFEPKARPMLKHPEVLYKKRKEAQFDMSGRPYHFLFYTTKPNFNQVLHDCSKHLFQLNEKLRKMGPGAVHPEVPLNVLGSGWIRKADLEEKLLEKLLDVEYEKFVEAMERLTAHKYSFEVASFIMEYRVRATEKTKGFNKPEVEKLSDDRSAVVVEGRRKTCRSEVRLVHPGTGKLSINGLSLIDFFEDLQQREEISKDVQLQIRKCIEFIGVEEYQGSSVWNSVAASKLTDSWTKLTNGAD